MGKQACRKWGTRIWWMLHKEKDCGPARSSAEEGQTCGELVQRDSVDARRSMLSLGERARPLRSLSSGPKERVAGGRRLMSLLARNRLRISTRASLCHQRCAEWLTLGGRLQVCPSHLALDRNRCRRRWRRKARNLCHQPRWRGCLRVGKVTSQCRRRPFRDPLLAPKEHRARTLRG